MPPPVYKLEVLDAIITISMEVMVLLLMFLDGILFCGEY